MAEMKKLNTRIKLRIDTLEAWQSSTSVLLPGEIALATVAASAGNGLEEPVVMMKIGTDEEKTFSQLPWSFYAKASDVLAEAKDADALETFVNGVIAKAGIASSDAMQALAGKVTTAEGKIQTLEGEMDAVEKAASDNAAAIDALDKKIGEDDVVTQINAAITALNLANTYEAKGEAAKVNTALETYKTSNDAAVKKVSDDLAAEISRAGVAEKANADAITAIKDGTTIDSFADVETALAGKEAAGEAAKAEAAAKAYADGLASNYDAKGSAATAEQNAKDYADGLAGNYDASGSAAKALEDAKKYTDDEIKEWVGDSTVAAQIEALKLSETYDAKGAAATAEANAKAHATSLNTAMNTRVDALEAKFGEGEGNVESQIAAAVAAEAELREAADSDLQDAIDALEALVGEDNVAEAIAAAVKAEKERAEGIEGGLETRLAAVEEDFLTSDDKQALQGQIDLIMNNPDTEKVINSISEFTQYIEDHGEIAEGLRTDINTNAGDIDAVEGRMTTAEGKITALETASATHAAQADLEALEGRVETAEGEIDTLQSDLDTAEGKIDGLVEQVGEGNVNERIAAAIEALKIGDYAKAADLTAAITQHNTDKAALEASIAKKADDSALAAIAKTGSTDDLVQGEMVLVFDCGGAAE